MLWKHKDLFATLNVSAMATRVSTEKLILFVLVLIVLNGQAGIVVRAHASRMEGLPLESDSAP